MTGKFHCIGKPTARQEAPDKVRGRTVYAGDVYLPGMLHGAALRSPLPHARILAVDPSAALACPGVKAVLTAADLPQRRLGKQIKDQPVLAHDRVRFTGERVAAVVADTEEIARRAAALIRVEYEPLPAVFEIEEALQAGAPLVHEDMADFLKPGEHPTGNTYACERIVTGNLEDGWAESDYVYEDVFSTQSVHQGYLENHVTIALAEPDGRCTFWSTSKSPFGLRQHLAEYVGVPENHIRVLALPVGGDFGGKGVVMDEPLCYYLSLCTGRPVRMAMRRGEELAGANPRHPSVISIKSGVKKNGELVARQIREFFNSGAYGGTKPSLIVESYTRAAGPYRIPHLLLEAYSVYSNNEPCGYCRGPGHAQVVFAVESHMDMLARRLAMDPLAFRQLNVLQEGEAAPTGERWIDLRGREVLETVARLGGWQAARRPGTGRGLALAYRSTGGGESGAVVKVNSDGSVEVLTGAAESGTGSWTVLRQIAAEELGVAPQAVRVVQGDTAVAPFDSGSAASRATFVSGWAVCLAAQKAAAILKEAAAGILGCAPGEVIVQEGIFRQSARPDQVVFLSEVAAKVCKRGPLIAHGSFSGRSKDTVAFAAQLAEVKVDRETGAVEVTRLATVTDVGRVINPPAAEGQVEGSVVQGMGFALWESLAKQEGRLCSSSAADYHQPTSLDLPEMETVFLEGAVGPAPFGGKGIGELLLPPVAAAIANALEEAPGVRIKDLPLTPEKVWRAIARKEQGKTGRAGEAAGVGTQNS